VRGWYRPQRLRTDLLKAQAVHSLIHAAKAARDDTKRETPISVVDDNVWVGELIAELLEPHGLDAVAYVSIDDFLADERRWHPGCLILDQDMPEAGGLEVVQALRDKGVVIPIVLITGKIDPPSSSHAQELGVCAVLERPFSVARLVQMVRTGLNRAACKD
jgi:FixJ family two-component response regulator